MTLRWFDKQACRLPEAYWLSFNPLLPEGGQWFICKLGQKIDPCDVISLGARTLHSFDQGVSYTSPQLHLAIQSLDAALVAPGRPSLLDFHNEVPNLSGGIHFNSITTSGAPISRCGLRTMPSFACYFALTLLCSDDLVIRL